MKSARNLFLAVLATLAGAAQADYGNYPGDFPTSTIDRAQVVAEVHVAQKDGDLQFKGDNYPVQWLVASSKTRAEVIAELREARRLGLLTPRGGDGNYPTATPEQERLIAEAGQRARQMMASTAR